MIVEAEQGSRLWDAVRCGIPTASNAKSIVTSQCKPASASVQETYALSLVEAACGISKSYQSPAMAAGSLGEHNTRHRMAFDLGVDIDKVGFVFGDDTKTWGASPDGAIEYVRRGKLDEGAEIKRLELVEHLRCLKNQRIPAKYLPQVFWCMRASKARRWHFRAQLSDTCGDTLGERIKDFDTVVDDGNETYVDWCECFEQTLPKFIEKLDTYRNLAGLCPIAEREIDWDSPAKVVRVFDDAPSYQQMVGAGEIF